MHQSPKFVHPKEVVSHFSAGLWALGVPPQDLRPSFNHRDVCFWRFWQESAHRESAEDHAGLWQWSRAPMEADAGLMPFPGVPWPSAALEWLWKSFDHLYGCGFLLRDNNARLLLLWKNERQSGTYLDNLDLQSVKQIGGYIWGKLRV